MLGLGLGGPSPTAHGFASRGFGITPAHARVAPCCTGNLQGHHLSDDEIGQACPGAPNGRTARCSDCPKPDDAPVLGHKEARSTPLTAEARTRPPDRGHFRSPRHSGAVPRRTGQVEAAARRFRRLVIRGARPGFAPAVLSCPQEARMADTLPGTGRRNVGPRRMPHVGCAGSQHRGFRPVPFFGTGRRAFAGGVDL